MNKCINCGKEATQRHHVVPRELGGNNQQNLVWLCDNCHGLIHNIQYNNIYSHSQLTKIGIEKARAAGKQIGGIKGKKLHSKKEDLCNEVIPKYAKTFGGNLTDLEIMKQFHIAKNTYYKYKKQLMNRIKQ